jgi:hypothetical protein
MQIKEAEIKQFIEGKRVIILGGAPTVKKTNERFTNDFDIIVRMNNYIHFNSIFRTDLYYSYFGRDIKKEIEELKFEDCRYIMCKYPNAVFTEHMDGHEIQGVSEDFSWVYEYRKNWFGIPYYVPYLETFIENFRRLNRIPTTGMSAILDVLRFKPRELYIAGFDFFASKIHHGKPWKEGDGNHDLGGERRLMGEIVRINGNVMADKTIMEAVK